MECALELAEKFVLAQPGHESEEKVHNYEQTLAKHVEKAQAAREKEDRRAMASVEIKAAQDVLKDSYIAAVNNKLFALATVLAPPELIDLAMGLKNKIKPDNPKDQDTLFGYFANALMRIVDEKNCANDPSTDE